MLDTFTNSVGLLIQNFVEMSFVDPINKAENFIKAARRVTAMSVPTVPFRNGWTIFYWAWWIAYAPFMGLFVARISKGRTIRELILVEVIGGSLGCWVFFAILGNAGLFYQLEGAVDLSAMIGDNKAPEAIVATIVEIGNSTIPFGTPLLIVFVVLAFIFGATTMDSSAYTLSTVASDSSGEGTEPARWHRFFWAIALATVSLSLMFAGGDDSLKALQAASVVVAIPLMVVLVLMVLSLRNWLKEDFPRRATSDNIVTVPIHDAQPEAEE